MRGDKLIIQKHHVKAAQSIIPLLTPKILQRKDIFVVSIAGESGSGKSEIAAVLVRLLRKNENMKSIIIQQDDYFVYPPKTNAEMRRRDISHVGPSEVRLGLLEQNLSDIVEGRSEIKKPLVIFEEDKITEEILHLEGVRVVIVEGTYTTLLHNVHQHIFIDRTYLDTRESRRERAREEQDHFLETVLEIEHRIISSHKLQADIIVTKNYEVNPGGNPL
jgi:uridine kinase